MSDEPYLFDVSVVALAHAGTPVSDRALSYIRDAIAGTIDAIVPHPALIGAHHILSSVYGFSSEEASQLMQRFMDAKRIHWYDEIRSDTTHSGLGLSAGLNIDGWDGYYAQVALEEGAETILTLDDDFDRIEDVSAEVILSPEEFTELNEYLGY